MQFDYLLITVRWDLALASCLYLKREVQQYFSASVRPALSPQHHRAHYLKDVFTLGIEMHLG